MAASGGRKQVGALNAFEILDVCNGTNGSYSLFWETWWAIILIPIQLCTHCYATDLTVATIAAPCHGKSIIEAMILFIGGCGWCYLLLEARNSLVVSNSDLTPFCVPKRGRAFEDGESSFETHFPLLTCFSVVQFLLTWLMRSGKCNFKEDFHLCSL